MPDSLPRDSSATHHLIPCWVLDRCVSSCCKLWSYHCGGLNGEELLTVPQNQRWENKHTACHYLFHHLSTAAFLPFLSHYRGSIYFALWNSETVKWYCRKLLRVFVLGKQGESSLLSKLFESLGGWRSWIWQGITFLILVIGNIQICC